jgi:hypothetical protein
MDKACHSLLLFGGDGRMRKRYVLLALAVASLIIMVGFLARGSWSVNIAFEGEKWT